MRSATVKKVGKRVLQIGLPVVILAFFSYQVKNNWSELTAHSFQWNPWLLVAAFGCFMLQELSYGLVWRAVLLKLGYTLPLRISLRIYLSSEFVRYIPGNVWHVLARILWVSKYGVPRSVAFASMTIELITKLASAVLIFAVSLLFWRDLTAVSSLSQERIVLILGIGTILGLFVVLYPPVLNGLLNVALRLLKREPVTLAVRYRDILLVTLGWCASWIVAGSGFYLLVLGLWPSAPLIAWPIGIGIYALGWDVGFVSFLTPSGLGFREGAISALLVLTLPMTFSLAVIIALLSRFVSTLAELLCVGAAYLGGGQQQVRELQQDQQLQHDERERQDTPTSLPEEVDSTEVYEENEEDGHDEHALVAPMLKEGGSVDD